MKNFKFLSSLALAGMLTTGFMGTSLAAKTDVPTQPLGIYKKLVASKTVVPFILANKNDVVTIKDIKDSGKFKDITSFKGIAVPAEDTVVSTGDVFQADGVEYTVIIYGDVKKDGQFDINDVTTAAKAAVKLETLDDVQSEVADVINDGQLTVADVTHLAKYSVGLETNLVKDPPPAEPAEEVKQNVTVELKDKNINNVNKGEMKATIKIAEQFKEPVTISKIKILGEDGKPLAASTDISVSDLTINAYTSQMEATLNLNSTNIPEGKETTLQLVSSDGEVIATITVGKHTTEITSAKLVQTRTNRDNTLDASLYTESLGKSKIVKMYYKYEITPEQPTPSTITTIDPDNDKTVKSVDFVNGVVDNKMIANDLKTTKSYDLYYILEDEYGSRTAYSTSNKLVIKKDTNITESEQLKEVAIPSDLSKVTKLQDGTFTWKLVKGNITTGMNFVVTLYNNGTPVCELTKQGEAGETNSVKFDEFKEGSSNIMDKAGSYTVKVYMLGNADTEDSNVVESAPVVIEKLNKVNNFKFSFDENAKKQLTWESDYAVDDIDYKVELIEIGYAQGKETESPIKTWTTTGKKKILTEANDTTVGSSIQAGHFYKVKITTLKKDNQILKTDSDEFVSEGFFALEDTAIEPDTTLGSLTTNSIRVKVTPVSVTNKTTTYKVKVYKVNQSKQAGITEPKFIDTNIVKDIVLDANNKAVVDGLEAGTEYAFVVIANVAGIEGTSPLDAATKTASTLREMPALENLLVSSEPGAGKIALTYTEGRITGVSINGVEYKSSEYNLYPAQLKEIAELLESDLHKGDTLYSYTGDKLSVKCGDKADTRTFSKQDINLELDANDKYERSITAANAKSVILKGSDSIFDISGITAEKLLVENGVTITDTNATQKITLAAGTRLINGVTVTNSSEAVIKVAPKTQSVAQVSVIPNNGTNDLTFDAPKGIELTFLNETGYGATQSGNVTIKASSGSVKVIGSNMDVASNLNIETTNVQSIDILGENKELTGNKTVTVTNSKESNVTTTVNAYAKTVAPIDMVNVELRTYTDEELLGGDTPDNGKILGKDTHNHITSENIKQVRDYLAQFGVLDVKGDKVGGVDTYIKVSVDKDSNKVTFTLPAGVSSAAIQNLK